MLAMDSPGEPWELCAVLDIITSYTELILPGMYAFSPGAMLAVGSPGGFYLALAELLLPTHVCI